MGQVIDELCTTIKIIVGFSATADEFDAIGLLKLIQKAILNVQSQQYFPQQYIWLRVSFTTGDNKKDQLYKNTIKSLKITWKWWNNLAFL